MNSRRRPPASSFELLLDPICNTFGCVIFMCMLVSLLVQNSSERVQEWANNFVPLLEASQIHTRHRELQLRQEELRSQLEPLKQFLSRHLAPEAFQLTEQIVQLENECHNLRVRLEQIQKSQAAISQLVQSLSQQKQQQQKLLEDIEDQQKTLKKELEKELAQPAQTVPFPKERITRKIPVGLDLRYGRLYLWHRYDERGNRIGLNTEEYVVVEETPKHILTAPKPYAGIPLDDPSVEDQIARRLRPFPPSRWYLDFVIFPDSFDQFQKLKRIIVQLGYEYRLVLIREGGIVYDRGGQPIVQ